jgi:putative copper export protein
MALTVYPVVRGLILLSLLALVGTVIACRLVERSRVVTLPAEHATIAGWMQRLPGLLAWFLLILSMLRGGLQVLSFSDPGMPVDSELAAAILTVGPWGKGWMVQTAAAFILLALSWLLRTRPGSQWTMTAVLTTVLLLAQSGMGHGVEDFWQPSWLGRAVHFGHLLGAGLWIGTLMILLIAVLPSLRAEGARGALGDVVRGFSTHARIGAALVVASGVVATFAYTDSLGQLTTTDWGRLLLLKVVTFVVIAASGWYNWRVVTPRLLAGSPPAAAQLRTAVTIECLLALILLGATALLVAAAIPFGSGAA